MGWFGRKKTTTTADLEIERLRLENERLARELAQQRAAQVQGGTTVPASAYDSRAVNEEEWRLAISGEKIKAIKVYRERTGCSLKDAKEAIDAVY